MLIDANLLGEEALKGLAIAFINAEQGNEFDDIELSVKVEQALRLIASGDLLILFSELHQEAHLIKKEDFNNKCIGR
ncbi:YheU family protein [Vibrio owensii]|uniref:YheU family protein n=1 Tax=Vibrio harveyi group TaxID=717610 RepID=UPI003CC6154C